MQHEQKGDLCCASGAWGQAKLEYESAIALLKKDPGVEKSQVERLMKKLGNSKEELSRQHCQSGDDLLEAGYSEEAREYYLLGLELASSAQLRLQLEMGIKKTESTKIGQFDTATFTDFELAEETAEQEFSADDDQMYFMALCNTLPGELGEIYMGYGEPFRKGYIALNQGYFETAAQALIQAQAEHPSSDSYIALELATAYVNLTQYDSARNLLEPFLRRHPDALPAYRMLCEIFWDNGQYEQADNLLASVPQDLQDSQAFVLMKGESLYRQGKYSETIAWYRTALKAYGWHEHMARALAVTLESANQPESARDLYGDIIQRCRLCASSSTYPAHIDTFTRRRYAELSSAAGDDSIEILELFLSLVRDDPANAPIYYRNVSRIYANRGNRTEALRFQRIAETFESREPDSE